MARSSAYPLIGAWGWPQLGAAVLLLALAVALPACRPEPGHPAPNRAAVPGTPTVASAAKSMPATSASAVSAGRETLLAEPVQGGALSRATAALTEGRAQWPKDGKAQAEALAARVEQAGAAINAACGTELRVLLNETGRGGMATGTGIVYVDFSLVWRLREDALAVLVAHEFAHEVLGHAEQLARLHYEGAGNPSYFQQVRGLERQADQYAGSILARTKYDPGAFKELLALGNDTEWSDPRLRSYYRIGTGSGS